MKSIDNNSKKSCKNSQTNLDSEYIFETKVTKKYSFAQSTRAISSRDKNVSKPLEFHII